MLSIEIDDRQTFRCLTWSRWANEIQHGLFDGIPWHLKIKFTKFVGVISGDCFTEAGHLGSQVQSQFEHRRRGLPPRTLIDHVVKDGWYCWVKSGSSNPHSRLTMPWQGQAVLATLNAASRSED